MNILFLCTSNIHRSLTAEHLCQSIWPHIHFKSASLSEKYCKQHNSTLCTESMLQWANKVFIFEDMHLERIVENTGDTFTHKIHNLNIDDIYKYMQDELITELTQKIPQLDTIETH